MSNDVMKVTNFVVQLLADADWFPVLLIQQDPKIANNREHKVFAHPPPELWVKDGCILRIGQDHETVVGELLSDQRLVSFADVQLVDVPFDEGLKRFWAKKRICLLHVHSAVAGRHGGKGQGVCASGIEDRREIRSGLLLVIAS